MKKLSAAEYFSLTNPVSLIGDTLLNITLQELCLLHVIRVERRWIKMHRNEHRTHLRFFFLKSSAYNDFKPNRAQKFVTQLFVKNEIIRFYNLRVHVNKKLGNDLSLFRNDLVQKDLKTKKMVFLTYFPNSDGRQALKSVNASLNRFKGKFELELFKKNESPEAALQGIGVHALFLDSKIQDQFGLVSRDIRALRNLSYKSITENPYEENDEGGSGWGYGGFGGGSGGFSFGGGSFGGGGASGSW